jgi:membrane-associated phospholipid phosphatase
VEGILEWGYHVIHWMQQLSPAADPIFRTITDLGSEQAYLILIPFVYWSVGKRRGLHLGFLLLLSALLNYGLKDLFNQPRPSPERVKVLASETNPGLPSGHSQNSVTVYGYLADQIRRPWAWFAVAWLAFSIGVSRVYLGAHFPTDVLAGWFVGLIVLVLYLRLEPHITDFLQHRSWNVKVFLALVLPIVGFALYRDENGAQTLGVLWGLMVGVLLEWRWVGFSALGSARQRALRLLVGGLVLVAIWLGLKVAFASLSPTSPSGSTTTFFLVLRLIRYAALGLWGSLGAPYLFVRSGLAAREPSLRPPSFTADEESASSGPKEE